VATYQIFALVGWAILLVVLAVILRRQMRLLDASLLSEDIEPGRYVRVSTPGEPSYQASVVHVLDRTLVVEPLCKPCMRERGTIHAVSHRRRVVDRRHARPL